MEVFIESYRGFSIYFNTYDAEFYSALEEYNKRSKSYDAIKKGIDGYLKDNQQFKSFFVVKKPDTYNECATINITGIRKDGRFCYKNDKGELKQISDYEEKDYWIVTDENKIIIETLLASIQIIKADINDLNKKRNLLIRDANFETLDKAKSKYIIQ